MRILIIEDEKKIIDLLKTGLEKEGYAVDCVMDGEAGQRRFEYNHMDYDMAILDLMLPGKTGSEICRYVREKGITTPILILTASGGTDSKVSLLDSGADDYLVKPFSLVELMARVRALTRRPKASLPKILKVGELTLDPVKIKAFFKKRELELTLKEFRLLEYLMRNPDQAIPRNEIMDKVWDFNFDSFSNVVDVHIRHLRKKLGREAQNMLETVWGVGYKLKSDAI